MSNDLDAVLARVRAHATCSLPDAAMLLTTSVNRVYGMAKSGSVAGIPVLRVGAKNLRLPSKPLLSALGLLDESREGES